ncbi:MAG: hypothetical protein KDA25_13360 [Phycisphaerales bacterium]|nr:hypothetical protein [Phycisphaerales bacterium]
MSAPPTPDVANDRSTLPPGRVLGDRLCTSCGYNLIGQTIQREPHYDLFIIRCPECGAVAATQEYPLVGRWAFRLGMLCAALWIMIMVALWAGTTGAFVGLGIATGEIASQSLQNTLWTAYTAWQEQQTPGSSYNPTSFQAWWSEQDVDAMVAASGGWRGVFDLEAFIMLIPLSLVPLGFGVLWGIALFRQRRTGLLVWGAIVMAVSTAISCLSYLDWIAPTSPWTAARSVAGPPSQFAAMAYMTLSLWTGLLLGRPIARGLVRLFLPPRLRGPLAILWTTDGRTPPGMICPRGWPRDPLGPTPVSGGDAPSK